MEIIFWLVNLKERDHSEDLGVDGRIILDCILQKEPGELSLCIDWLRAGRSDHWGLIPDGGWEVFSPTPRPDRFWGSPSLLSNGYQGLLSLGNKATGA